MSTVRLTLPPAWPFLTALMMVGLAAQAHARGSHALVIDLSAPDRIVEGDRMALVAEVRVHPSNDLPVLVTPSSEGTAIEVVRGRLLRADAEETDDGTLRFRVPMVARSPGTSVVRIRVLAYACDDLCRELRAERTLTLRVHPR